MRHSQAIVVAVLAVLSSLTAPFATARASAAGTCDPRGSHTLLLTRTFRVYRTRKYGRGESTSDLVVSCWLQSARQTVLVTESPRDENNDVRLTAVQAAPGSSSVIGISSTTVGVGLVETDLLKAINVQRGRTLNSNEAELLSCEEGCDVSVFGFVVAPSGSLAFLGSVSGASSERASGLYTKPVHSPIHLLELGAPIQQPDPGMPTISNISYNSGVLSWESNDSPKSTPLA
jgi:hypothetical protein